MSQINITNLTFAYDGSYDNIFENVSFQIDTNWKLGFTGRNGRGKTTFLKLLQGKLTYSGSISANVDFEYFPFEVQNPAQNTANIIMQISQNHEDWQLLRELSLLEVDEQVLHRPFSTLSGGEQTKCLLCALFLKENSFLLIDEPTNHLDMAARQLLSRYLRGKSGFILVSHDRAFLDGCVDHILSINRTDIEIQQGNFSSWYANKMQQDAFEYAENHKLKGEISRLNTAAARTTGWADQIEDSKIGSHSADRGYIGHKSAKMMKRAKGIATRQQTAIDKKSALLKNIESTIPLKLHPLPCPSGSMISLENISISYGNQPIFAPVSLTVSEGERVLLQGKNGCGKTSLLKLILGEPIAFDGQLHRKTNLTLSYVSQKTDHLHGNLTDYAAENHLDESLFKAILRKLDFSRLQFEKNMEDFSGGQKKKVLLAHSLCTPAHIYVWDEPLNFVDVFSRIQLEELLLKYAPTMIFVEHDMAFSEKIATKTVEIL